MLLAAALPPATTMPRRVTEVAVVPLLRLLWNLALANASPMLTLAAADDEPDEKPGSAGFWVKLLVSIGLVLSGGVFAGCAISYDYTASVSSD